MKMTAEKIVMYVFIISNVLRNSLISNSKRMNALNFALLLMS